jgi:hypothetical protein
MTRYPPNELVDHRSDPHAREVLSDWCEDRGWRPTKLGVAIDADADDDAAADDDDDAAADDDDDDDAADAAAADDADDDDDAAAAAADADDADDDDDDADDAADDDADDDADDIQGINKWLREEMDMRDGLKIIRLPGGYYGRSVTRVGWVRRVGGDEYLLLPGSRSIWRTGGERTTLDRLASHGPGDNHQMTAPQVGEEEINRLLTRRALPADEHVWAPHCPKPKDWDR